MSDELEKPISQPSAADTPCAHAGQLPERLEGEHAVYELKQNSILTGASMQQLVL